MFEIQVEMRTGIYKSFQHSPEVCCYRGFSVENTAQYTCLIAIMTRAIAIDYTLHKALDKIYEHGQFKVAYSLMTS